ncbi:MAG: SMI1/KNR4 family protein [Kofleriaceae bacterium]
MAKAPARAKAKPAKPRRGTAKARPTAKSRSKSPPKPTAKPAAKPKAKSPAKPARAKPARRPATRRASRASVPAPHVLLPSSSPTGTVVQILDAERPVDALRAFLDAIAGPTTPDQGQIVLGAAQLALLPLTHEHRGGSEVMELLDLVLARWTDFPDRNGFHAQELLRNAFAAVGGDRERIAKLAALVPIDATPELRFNVASAFALAGQRDAMLRAVAAALAVGASTNQFIRDPDFAEYTDDPELRGLLLRATAPAIPVDTTPHLAPLRAALDSVIETLEQLGAPPTLAAPASLDAILAAEQVAKLQLPNEYRALLTLSDGPKLWEYRFLGTADYHGSTDLADQARSYFEIAGRYGPAGIDDCVPLANCGQPNDWLLYDPHGRIRGGQPGIVMMLNADEQAFEGLVAALEYLESIARDVLETN